MSNKAAILVSMTAFMAAIVIASPSSSMAYGSQNFLDVDIAPGEKTIVGSTNCSKRSNGTLRDISLSGCTTRQCEVKLDKSYNGNVTLTLGSKMNQSLIVSVDAYDTQSKIQRLYYKTYTRPSTYPNLTLAYEVKFPKSTFEKRVGNYTLQVEITDGNNGTQTCQRFSVYLSSCDKMTSYALLFIPIHFLLFVTNKIAQ